MPADITDTLDRIYKDSPQWWPYGLRRDMLDDAHAIVKRGTDEQVGFAGWQFRHEADGQKVGYYAIGLLPEFRGKGYAKAALKQLFANKPQDVSAVRAFIVPGNAPSEGLAASLGVPVVHKSASLRPSAPWVTFGEMFKVSRYVPSSYGGVALQQYMPLVPRRAQLTPNEDEQIETNKRNWFPTVFTSMADSPAADMHSPGKGALMAGLGAGALAGGGAHFLGASPSTSAGVGTVGGLLAALAAYHATSAGNAGIEEMMRRIPPDGTRRDMEADPVLQAGKDRDANTGASQEALRTAQLLAALQATKQAAKQAMVGKVLSGAGRLFTGRLAPLTVGGSAAVANDALQRIGGEQDYFTKDNLPARLANIFQNTGFMAGGMLGGKLMGGMAGHGAGGQVAGALGAYAMLPGKDLAQSNIYTGQEAVRALKDMAQAQADAASHAPAASNITVQAPKAEGMSNGQMAALGLGGAAVIGGGGYLANKLLEALKTRNHDAQAGRIRVTLPTRRQGDVETQLDLPMQEIPMSNTLMGRVQRDFRSRLREETSARTRKVTLSPEEKARRAAVLARYRL